MVLMGGNTSVDDGMVIDVESPLSGDEDANSEIDMYQTKVVDVDAEIEVSPRRGRSPTKRQANPHLFQSLKAQGYEESAESKSKLVYDFKKNSPAAAKQSYRYKNDFISHPLFRTKYLFSHIEYCRSNSPVKSEGSSAVNPHQFICAQPQQKQNSPAVSTGGSAGYRSVSPTRYKK